MSTQPRVSIIVRTNDRPRLLRRALESINAQTYSDWHAVVIDDGDKPEQTRKTLAEVLPQSSYTIFPTEDTAGADTILNFGVAKATAPLVAFHDDDDTWHPDFLKNSVGWLDTNPSALAVASRVELIFEHDTGEEFTELRREIFWANVNEFSATHLIRINRYIPTSMVIRRHVFDELGGYRDDLPVVGDWEFNLRLALHGDVGFLPEKPLAYWHHRPESAGHESNTMYREEHLHTHYDHAVRDEHLRKYVKEHGLGLVLALAGPPQRQAMHTDGQLGHLIALAQQQEQQLTEQRHRIETLEQHLVNLAEQTSRIQQSIEELKHTSRESALPVTVAKKIARRTGVYRMLRRS